MAQNEYHTGMCLSWCELSCLLFQICSICLASTTTTAHMTKVIGGDLGDDMCSSFGGSMRQFSTGINLTLPDLAPDRVYYGALLLVSADFPAAGQFRVTFVDHCYISQTNRCEVVNFMKGDLAFC